MSRLGPCLLEGVRDGVGWPERFEYCRGDIYENKFLWGVDGVRLAGGGSEDEERLVGGVLDLEGSLIVVEWVDAISGDRLGGVGCGIVVSNNSDLKSVENVRFASSAAED